MDFYGDQIHAALATDEEIYVPIRPICEALGLTWPGQWERIKGDPVLGDAVRSVQVSLTERGVRAALCLPLKFIPGWLFGIQTRRVKPELRDRILRYQRECYDVLWNAFKGDILPAAPPAEVLDLSPIEQALALAEAVAALARQQLEMEGRVGTMAEYTRTFIQKTRGQLAAHADHLAAHEERIGALELHISGGATISEAQAAEIAGAVKAVAMLLTAAGDANGFGRVWGELYRRYRVTSYHNLPSTRYAEALGWLQGWYGELVAADH